MSGLLENIFWWGSIPLLGISLGSLLWHHLYHQDVNHANYLAVALIQSHSREVEQRRLHLSAPLLLLIKLIVVCASIGILSTWYWSTPSPQGTVILTNGSIKVPEHLQKPIHVVSDRRLNQSAENKFEFINLRRSNQATHNKSHQSSPAIEKDEDRLYSWLPSPQLTPLSVQPGAQLNLPQLTGIPEPLSVLSEVLTSLYPADIIYPSTKTRIIRNVKATWVGSDTARLKVEVLTATQKEIDELLTDNPLSSSFDQVSYHLEQFISDHNSVRGGEWIDRGEFKKGQRSLSHEWVSHGNEESLSGSAIRVIARQSGHLFSDPYSLCTPLSKVDWHYQDDRDNRHQTLTKPPTKLTQSLSNMGVLFLNQSPIKLNTPLAVNHGKLQYYFGDTLSELNASQIQTRLQRGEVWTPLASPSALVQWPREQRATAQTLGLTAPSLPTPFIKFNQYTSLPLGSPLLWMVQPRITQKNSAQQWDSSDRVASWLLNAQGTRQYHFGLDLRELTTTSVIGLNTALFSTIHSEKRFRSRCLEWIEGEPLVAILPEDTEFYYLNDAQPMLPIGQSTDNESAQSDIKLASDTQLKHILSTDLFHQALQVTPRHLDTYRQGVIIARSDQIHHDSITNDDRSLVIVRQRAIDSVVDTPSSSVRLNVNDIDHSPTDSITVQLLRLSVWQRWIFISLLMMCMLALCALAILRRYHLIRAFGQVVIPVLILGLIYRLIIAQSPIELTALHIGNSSDFSQEEEFINHGSSNVHLNVPETNQHLPLLMDPRLTPFSSMARSVFKHHQGSTWVSEIKPSKSRRKLLVIKDQNIRRDLNKDQLLVTLLLSTPANAGVEADLYIDGVREDITILPQGTLVGRWVKDRGQSVLPIKIELSAYRDQTEEESANQARATGRSQAHTLMTSLPIAPKRRREYWVWGRQAIPWVEAAGARVISPPSNALDTPLPHTLKGIVLNNVSPSKLSIDHIERLYDWVHNGGTLMISGELSQKDRVAYKALEQLETWRSLTPLSVAKSIPKDRSAQIVFIIDRSGSTDKEAGGPGIDQVTAKLSSIVSQLPPHDEISLISFGGGMALTLPPTERHRLEKLPVPALSRGGTELHPALELALTYRRPSLPAHWVIITDGEWGDDPQRLLGSLPERIEASGVNLTLALYNNRREPKQGAESNAPCEDPCLSLSKKKWVSTVSWADFHLDNLHEPISEESSPATVKLEATRRWESRIGGSLPTVDGYTPMSLRTPAHPLVYANGDPVFVEKDLGLGRIIQLMATPWRLSSTQWASLLGTNENTQGLWRTQLTTPSQGKAYWSSKHGSVSGVKAYSHEGVLQGGVTLNTTDKSNLYYWRPISEGESIMVDCTDSTTTPPLSIDDCLPLWLKLNDPTLYMLQSSLPQGPSPTLIRPSSSTSTLPRGARALSVYQQALQQSIEQRPLKVDSQTLLLPNRHRLKQAVKEYSSQQTPFNNLTLLWLSMMVIIMTVILESWRWYRIDHRS